jgi:tryptophan synthase alpha chain
MNRVAAAFARCRAEGRPALVVYLTHGDPSPAATPRLIEAAAAAGADVIELGVPFSDPSADGVVIQAAMGRALAAGATLGNALDAVARLRGRGGDVPVVLFGYYNPIFVRGVERFAGDAAASGVDAVLTVDLPIDELAELAAPLAARGVAVVPLAAPTSTPARLARLAAFAPPFVYYVSMTGVTGAAFRGAAGGAERIEAIRVAARAPVAIGFGIKTGDDARAAAALADGVVVGSAIVDRIASAEGDVERAAAAVGALVAELRAALGPAA